MLERSINGHEGQPIGIDSHIALYIIIYHDFVRKLSGMVIQACVANWKRPAQYAIAALPSNSLR